MVYFAVLVPGILAVLNLPVTLMPDVDIPQIKVHVNYPAALSREMENNIVRRLRTKLLQTQNIESINSETENGQAVLNLQFKYGTNIDLAYIECNEKIDAAAKYLPKNMERPTVIKASVTDIPVFTINISPKGKTTTESDFLELSELAQSVIKRRLEQIEQVAFVDITGYTLPEIQIIPNRKVMTAYGLSLSDIENALTNNNINYGSLTLVSGQYNYIIRFENKLKTINDLKKINLKLNNRIIQLASIAEIRKMPAKRTGLFLQNRKQAVSLDVIMQSKAGIGALEDEVKQSLNRFRQDYKNLDFTISRDNSLLLKYSISNLGQTLVLGIALSFAVMFLFLGNLRLSLIAAVSIPSALLISLLFFYILNISVNIISLSGLILGVGLMIDNAVIVIDNISGYLITHSIPKACIIGTHEIIRPLLSSVLTTIAVFFPLIFISGISGALFYDQAMAVGLGLLASFIVSVTLLPVLFNLFITEKVKFKNYTQGFENLYQKGHRFIFKHHRLSFIFFLILAGLSAVLFKTTDKKQMPEVQQVDFMLHAAWNENISLRESEKRIQKLYENIKNNIEITNSYLGRQQFLLKKESKQSYNQFSMYIKAKPDKNIEKIKQILQKTLNKQFPLASFTFVRSKTAYEYIFPVAESDIAAETISAQSIESLTYPEFASLIPDIKTLKPYSGLKLPEYESFYSVKVNAEKCLLYNLKPETLYKELKSLIESVEVSSIKSLNRYLPIVIKSNKTNLNSILSRNFIINENDEKIPLHNLISIKKIRAFKKIYANNHSEYIPLEFKTDYPETLMQNLQAFAERHSKFYFNFSGAYFAGNKLIKELLWVLLISVALLYFILAAQFESLVLPLIILIELPIDIFGALLLLELGGYSLNLMSAIGIVVMSGIIINDSILKIDAINQFRLQGFELNQAIEKGGQKRLKSILMTSFTTIFALLPLLFFSGVGADLQKPFAITVIGGLTLGTIVSLYLVPLAYNYLYQFQTPRSL